MREKNIEITIIDKAISGRLKYRRRLLGITQKEFAEHIGVSSQQIYKYECGINRISCGTLHVFAELLKVPVSYFFGDETDKFTIRK